MMGNGFRVRVRVRMGVRVRVKVRVRVMVRVRVRVECSLHVLFKPFGLKLGGVWKFVIYRGASS